MSTENDNFITLDSINEIQDIVNGDFIIMTANVAVVRDIHEQYGVTSVPTMLEVEKGKTYNLPQAFQLMHRRSMEAPEVEAKEIERGKSYNNQPQAIG